MKQQRHKALACLIMLFARYAASAQDLVYSNPHIGFNIAANLAFGTHYQRAGINLNFFYVNRRFQANTELRLYYSFKSPGPKQTYPELVLSQGLLLGYNKGARYFNPFLNAVSNQTAYRNAVAYAYNAYFNKVRTTQQTGIAALQFNSIAFITENDLLARPALDRFRTGAFLLQYQYQNKFQAAINCAMWTGQMGRQRTLASSPIRSGCYMDTTAGVYAAQSHGLLSLQLKCNLAYSQNIQANVGVDAEQVRNAVQNKFIHDMPFLPEKWRTKNCHIPMIDSAGQQYLYKQGQQIRKPKPYLNVCANAPVFY